MDQILPPPEHARVLFHWVKLKDRVPEVAMWRDNVWQVQGQPNSSPYFFAKAGYIYLRPAVWRDNSVNAEVAFK